MAGRTEDWLVIGVIGFLGGLVANIVVPIRRGALGFLSAAIVGVFCGGVSGIIAHAYDAPYGIQYGVAALVGVMGDRILSSIMVYRNEHQINIHGGQNNINSDVHGDQTHE